MVFLIASLRCLFILNTSQLIVDFVCENWTKVLLWIRSKLSSDIFIQLMVFIICKFFYSSLKSAFHLQSVGELPNWVSLAMVLHSGKESSQFFRFGPCRWYALQGWGHDRTRCAIDHLEKIVSIKKNVIVLYWHLSFFKNTSICANMRHDVVILL